MYIHNLNNVLFHIGSLEVRYYGLTYVIGFVLTWILLRWAAKNKHIAGISADDADELVAYMMVGMVMFARFFFLLFYDPSIYFKNPLEYFYFWHGGMSFHGGLIGAILAVYLFFRKKDKPKVSVFQSFDVMVVTGAFALFLGRIANFLNQELYGRVSDVAWCVIFPAVDNLCRHPSQLYEAASHLLTFIILIWLYWVVYIKRPGWTRHIHKKEGFVFWSFIALYGFLRVITDFWRDDAMIFAGLSGGQILSLIMGIVGVFFLLKYIKRSDRHKQAKP